MRTRLRHATLRNRWLRAWLGQAACRSSRLLPAGALHSARLGQATRCCRWLRASRLLRAGLGQTACRREWLRGSWLLRSGLRRPACRARKLRLHTTRHNAARLRLPPLAALLLLCCLCTTRLLIARRLLMGPPRLRLRCTRLPVRLGRCLARLFRRTSHRLGRLILRRLLRLAQLLTASRLGSTPRLAVLRMTGNLLRLRSRSLTYLRGRSLNCLRDLRRCSGLLSRRVLPLRPPVLRLRRPRTLGGRLVLYLRNLLLRRGDLRRRLIGRRQLRLSRGRHLPWLGLRIHRLLGCFDMRSRLGCGQFGALGPTCRNGRSRLIRLLHLSLRRSLLNRRPGLARGGLGSHLIRRLRRKLTGQKRLRLLFHQRRSVQCLRLDTRRLRRKLGRRRLLRVHIIV
ncbi:hypothetical protein ABZU76_20425 [Amycolatopsis sp. NPDC005232]|uniref:hypothetical protein n=1 Tax=Amycolatopsis sp. NPDC005232 TaxID=3157027 RepID=UPI0033A82317